MYFGTGDAVPADLRSRAAAARGHALKPTGRRRARHARQSTRPHDHRVLTAVSDTSTPQDRTSGGDYQENWDRNLLE